MDSENINITSLHSQAPGKLILLGEYAVLRGAPAVVMAVNRRASVFLQPSPHAHGILIAPDVGIRELPYHLTSEGNVEFKQPIDDRAVAFVRAALETVHQRHPLPPLNITISTAEFFYQNTTTKLGLGSSAAVTVSLITALLRWVNPQFSTDDAFKLTVLELALATHQKAQGKQGSGVDIAASTFGGILQYTMPVVSTQLPPEIRSLSLPAGLYLRFVWTRRAASTTQLVRQVNQLREQHPQTYHRLFSELIYLAEQGSLAFQRQDVPAFLEIVDQYYHALAALSQASGAPIISDVHQQIYQVAHSHQVIYKPSGAGEGDFGILFAQNELNVIDAVVQLEKMGFPSFSFQIDTMGVTTNIERGD